MRFMYCSTRRCPRAPTKRGGAPTIGALKLNEVEVVMPKADGDSGPARARPASIKEAISGKGASGAIVSADGQIVAVDVATTS